MNIAISNDKLEYETMSLLRKRSLRSSVDLHDKEFDEQNICNKSIKQDGFTKMKFPSINSPVKTNNKKTIQDIIEDRRFKGLSDDENSKNSNNRKRSSGKKSQNLTEEQSTDVNSQTLTSEKELQPNRNGFPVKNARVAYKEEKLSKPKVVTSHSFKNRNYSKKWTEKETKLFYRCLSIFGTDFSMISLMSKNRTRSQIINKFHKEEKENSNRIEEALKAHRKCDTKIVKKYIRYFEQSNSRNDNLPLARKGSEQSQNLENIFNRGSRNNSMNSVNSLDSVDLCIHKELNGFLTTSVKYSRS